MSQGQSNSGISFAGYVIGAAILLPMLLGLCCIGGTVLSVLTGSGQ